MIADHRTGSIVIAVRGSISLRDIFTDLTAASEKFDAEGLPPDSMAHKGMIAGAKYLKRKLDEVGVLERAFAMYPHYDLILTGNAFLTRNTSVVLKSNSQESSFYIVKVFSFLLHFHLVCILLLLLFFAEGLEIKYQSSKYKCDEILNIIRSQCFV